MRRDEFLRELEALLELQAGALKGTEALQDTGAWDSLAVVSFMALADEKLDLTLSADKINACKSVPDLLGLLGDKVSD